MIKLHPDFLGKNGKKKFAILPYEDLRVLRAAKESEADSQTVSFDNVKKELRLK